MVRPRIEVEPAEWIAGKFDLPPLPAVARKVLTRIQSGDSNAAEIAQLLSADPALVAKILKIINSAYYGLPRRISELRQAVAYLGLSEIERLTLTASVMEQLAPSDSGPFERFWFHSFYAALISKRLVKRIAGLDAEDLHTAVLLHDIGKLVYLKFMPDRYRELVQVQAEQGCLIREAEEQLGYPSHQQLGSVLCDRWELPDNVRRACGCHEPEDLAELAADAPFRDEALVVGSANLLALLVTEELTADRKERYQSILQQTLGCDEEEFLLLMGEIYDLRSEVEQFLEQL